MKRWKSPLVLLGLLVVVTALTVRLGSAAAAPPADSGDQIPPGLAKVVFIHYDVGHKPEGTPGLGPGGHLGSGTSLACSDPTTNGTDQCDSFVYDGIHWADPSLPVHYSASLRNIPDDGFVNAIVPSAQTWEDDGGSYMDFTYDGTTGRLPSSLRNRIDGNNDVGWSSLARYRGAIAVAVVWYYPGTLEIAEADIIMNTDLLWSSTGAPDAYDVQNIATHEFGHFLMLGDLYDDSDSALTMYGYGAEGETKKSTLGYGDEQGIQAIYPSAATGNPPVANADGPYSGTEDIAITFDGSGSNDPDGDSLTYSWDFGDGATGTGVNPSHAYLYGGTFTVALTVDDGNGNTETDTTTATVTEVNDKPVANPDGPYTGTVGSDITFDGSASSDFDNQDGTTVNDQTLTYEWDFGDGSTSASTTSSTITHIYDTANTYTVTLVVNDGLIDSEPGSTSAAVSEPAEGTMHVGDLDAAKDLKGRSGNWEVFVTVTIHDDGQAAVANATVYGTWSGDAYTGSVSGTTDSGGNVTFTTGTMKGGSYVTFTVDDVTDTLTYDPGANHDPEDDSDGTSITVTK